MIRQLVVFSLALILLSNYQAFGAEPIPFKDFVNITEKAMDALDNVETVYTNPNSIQLDGTRAINNFKTIMKKYDRYVTEWPKDSKQGTIVREMESAVTFFGEGVVETQEWGADAARQARQSFKEYKKHTSKLSTKKITK